MTLEGVIRLLGGCGQGGEAAREANGDWGDVRQTGSLPGKRETNSVRHAAHELFREEWDIVWDSASDPTRRCFCSHAPRCSLLLPTSPRKRKCSHVPRCSYLFPGAPGPAPASLAVRIPLHPSTTARLWIAVHGGLAGTVGRRGSAGKSSRHWMVGGENGGCPDYPVETVWAGKKGMRRRGGCAPVRSVVRAHLVRWSPRGGVPLGADNHTRPGVPNRAGGPRRFAAAVPGPLG